MMLFSNTHYVPTTIIIIEKEDLCLANLKFILLCFEAMPGLKINLDKSEAMVLGCTPNAQVRIANLVNCKLGNFPIKYLGIPISPFKLTAAGFILSVLGNRVARWCGRYNTNSGKVTLINVCLSSLRMFIMGFYRLFEGTHAGFDKHRSSFYWNAVDNRKKYSKVHGNPCESLKTLRVRPFKHLHYE